MPLGISIYPNQHRADSTVLPVLTATGLGAAAFVKIPFGESGLYLQMEASAPTLAFQPPNKTLNPVNIYLRNMIDTQDAWTPDAGITEEAGFGLSRTSGEGFQGAVYNTPLDIDNCSIQAGATSTNLSAGISLQDGTNTITHDYTDVTVAHSLIFGQNGQGSIRELGAIPSNNGTFKYGIGDIGLIEVKAGVCRYYLVKPDDSLILLRTTRSKLTENPKAEAILYFTGSQLSGVYLHSNEEAVTLFENVAVLDYDQAEDGHDWQKWGNPLSRKTTADILEMADKTTRATFPNQKRMLKTLALTPLSQETEAYWRLVDVIEWHGEEREFIFVDRARKKNDLPTEWWAKFGSAFSDATINGCRFDHAVSIVEDYRTDYIPQRLDDIDPTVSLNPIGDAGINITISGNADDDVLLKSLQIYINGNSFGGEFLPSGGGAGGSYSVSVAKTSLAPGVNTFYVIATDYAGNQTQSNTQTFVGGNQFTVYETLGFTETSSRAGTVSRTETLAFTEMISIQSDDRVDITQTLAFTETLNIVINPATVSVTEVLAFQESLVLEIPGQSSNTLVDDENFRNIDDDGILLVDDDAVEMTNVYESSFTAEDVYEDSFTAEDVYEGVI